MSLKARVEIDYGLCGAHAQCVVLAPDVFDQDEQGRGVVNAEGAAKASVDELNRAVSSCPANAIRLLD